MIENQNSPTESIPDETMKSYNFFTFRKSLQDDKTLDPKKPDPAKGVATASADLAMTFWRGVHKRSTTNDVFSPFGVTELLALLRLGALGKTAKELQETLKLPANENTLSDGCESLIRSIQASDGVEMIIATALFPQSGLAVKKDMLAVVQEKFKGTIKHVSYNPPIKAVGEINEWVEKQTKKKIVSVIAPEDVDAKTRLVAVGALYFKGQWKTKFETNVTQLRPFYSDHEKSSAVQMMQASYKCPYAELRHLKCRAISLPYKGDRFCMVIVLPDDLDGLHEVEDLIETNFFQHVISQLSIKSTIKIEIPKFKVVSKFELNPVMESLGIQTILSMNAELGGIFEIPKGLYVSKVIQKVFLEVNEEGSQQPAQSQAPLKMRPFPKQALEVGIPFSVDHPFLFYVFDTKYNLPLFAGTKCTWQAK